MNKKRFTAFVLTLMTLMMLMCGAARAKETVRVGYFAFSGYHEMAEDGSLSGYGYEFLQKLATHTDWVYEYIGYDKSYSDALDMLRRGEVDIVTSVSKTPEREKEFLFSDQPIGTNATMMTVKAGNHSIEPGDYSTYNGIKVGMLDGNSKNKNFEDFAAEHGFEYEPVMYEGEAELAAALQADTVDAAVSGSLRAVNNEWIIESFDASEFYIVTRLDRPDLMKSINSAIEEMTLHDPDWRTALHAKYYAIDSGGKVMLDAEERDYIENLAASGQKLKVIANPDRPPYSYVSKGKVAGIFPDVFERIAEQLSIPYEFLVIESRADYYDLRNSGGADIVLDFTDDYYLAEKEGYKLAGTYMEMNFARLTRNGFSGKAKVIAIVAPSDILDTYAHNRYPDRTIVSYDTVSQCVKAVISGEVDSAILYSYTAEQAIQQDKNKLLTFTLLGDSTSHYSMGVNAEQSHLLLSCLHKAVAGLDPNTLSEIIVDETELSWGRQDTSLISFLYAHPVYFLLAALFICCFIVLCVVLILRIRNQRNLKKKVDEVSRRFELQKKYLADALNMADQANRAKTNFLNNMSHDIRTPMNAITGYTALAITHIDNKEQTRDYLSKIAQSSNHLLSLINDILDMSRIESGHVHVENRPENLADILHGLRNIVQADIHSKRLEFYIDTVDIANEDISCDKLRLSQVLLNLLSNAIKFTKPGGTVSLRVTQKPGSKENSGVYEFRVKDTGIGMSEEFSKHIFEPFTRERTSTVSGIQGTGLGMAITKNIVDMMNGTISVTSKQNVGTEFVVELEFEFSGQRVEPKPIVELNGLRALVADDDMVCCQSVAKMLREIGMRAEWTCYGKEAVIRAGEAHDMRDPYAVYIVDWSMPDQSGIETVRCIRRTVGDDAPIILLSAYDWTDIEGEAREAGVSDFISKPLFASDLHDVLEKTLGHSVEEEEPPVRIDNSDFKGRRLLLVEDNELNREIALEILSEAGFIMESAENGQIAYDMVANSEPGYYDMVLMDIQMPVMNGYEATEKIRSLPNPALAHIPVIAMTANAFEEDKQQTVKVGMDGYLAKPIDIEKMFKLLRGMIKKEK